MAVRTRKGTHFYLRDPDRVNPTGEVRGGIGDWRTRGQYCVGPGSQHVDGGTYTIIEDRLLSAGSKGRVTVSDLRGLIGRTGKKERARENQDWMHRVCPV